METEEKDVVTRIYINDEGNVIVTDLWESIAEDLIEAGDFTTV